jgi:hypothetical protein
MDKYSLKDKKRGNKQAFIKIKNLWHTLEDERTNHRLRKKYLQITYLIKDLYPEYIKNSHNFKQNNLIKRTGKRVG